ncbi:MAG: hypothetical protein F6K44_23960 [Moorea sp. SIO3E2]|nr:hypothetical protein [Moorena sp. SIO3E2]
MGSDSRFPIPVPLLGGVRGGFRFPIPDSRTQLRTAILGGMGAYTIELAICLAYNSLGLCGRFLLSVSLQVRPVANLIIRCGNPT